MDSIDCGAFERIIIPCIFVGLPKVISSLGEREVGHYFVKAGLDPIVWDHSVHYAS
jgi:hypothetical protein